MALIYITKQGYPVNSIDFNSQNQTYVSVLTDDVNKQLVFIDEKTSNELYRIPDNAYYPVILEGSGSGSSYRCGNNNTASAYYDTVSGGCRNTLTCSQNYTTSRTIAGGSNNTIAIQRKGTIAGGCRNCISTSNGYQPTIAGGTNNKISSSSYSNYVSIGGGTNNTNSAEYHSTIIGGRYNLVCGNSSTASGYNNRLLTTSSYVSCVSGACNTISASYSSASGFCNTISSALNYSSVSGFKNVISSSAVSIIGSNSCSAYKGANVRGSNIVTNRNGATFVNNLSIKNLPNAAPVESGSLWYDGGDNTVKYVP